jgi:NCAIR mutase (PurE)-related protein
MPNRRELGYVSAGSVSTIPATTGYGVATGGTVVLASRFQSELYAVVVY